LDFRKIIKFGKSSYVVSLPKDWLQKNRLLKGDVVYLNEVDNSLILLPKESQRRKELHSTELDVTKISIRDVERRIISAYIQNYNVIHIFGKDFASKSKQIKEAIQNIMALEIMEETSERIVAKDFLKMDELSLIDLLKRMDIITRAMFLDTIKTFDEDLVESIYERDTDVNRLTYLMYRSIQYYFENSAFANEKGFNFKKLITYSTAVRNIERIADNTKRIAKLLARVEMSMSQKEKIKAILNEIYVHYESIMKALYKNDVEKAFQHANVKHELIAEIRQFYDDVWKVKWAPNIIEKMKDIIDCCHAIGRDLYH